MKVTERFDRIAAKIGKEKALERAKAYSCSLILGRDFLETAESFRARSDVLREVEGWIAANA
jgi:hypothetical protein